MREVTKYAAVDPCREAFHQVEIMARGGAGEDPSSSQPFPVGPISPESDSNPKVIAVFHWKMAKVELVVDAGMTLQEGSEVLLEAW